MKTPFKIERYFAKYEFTTKYMLSSSDCESISVGEIFQLGKGDTNDLLNLKLGYTESQGHPELRDQISTLYTTVQPEEILVYTGAEEGIYGIINSILKYGDQVIVQVPCYQSLYSVAEMRGIDVIKWEMNEANHWNLDLEFLRNNITKRTKLVIINFPHNPTGKIISGNEYNEIIKICRENGIYLLNDEVYRFSEQNEQDRLPAMSDVYENGLSLGVLSKSFGLPGLRIGWVATRNEKAFEALEMYKDYTTICNSGPSELIAIEALRVKKQILNRTNDIMTQNLLLLSEFMDRHTDKFMWIKPKGSSIAFPRFLGSENLDIFVARARKAKEILILPGSLFDYESNFRVGFGRSNFEEALGKFEEFLTE